MDIREKLKAAIYGQESSSGKADTSKVNYAGAIGPMQITKPTFDGLKKNGVIPEDYDFNNPVHTKDAGEKLVDSLMDRYNNDPAKAAAAYYGGPKAVNKDGSLADFGDLKNPKAPTVKQYVSQVLARGGMSEYMGAPSAPKAPAAPTPGAAQNNAASEATGARAALSSAGIMDATREDNDPAAGATKPVRFSGLTDYEQTAAVSAVAHGADVQAVLQNIEPVVEWDAGNRYKPVTKEQGPDIFSYLEKAAAKDLADAQARDAVTFGSQIGQASLNQTIPGQLWKNYVRGDHEPDGTQATEDELKGLTEDQQLEILAAGSVAERAALRFEFADTRDMEKNIAATGGWRAVGASLLAGMGDPTAMLGGYAVAKSMAAGSIALAAAGKGGQAAAYAFGENLVANIGYEAVRQSIGGEGGVADFMAAGAFSLIPGALQGASVMRSAARAAEAKAMLDIIKGFEAREAQLLDRATANLGDNATVEQLKAEVERLRNEDISKAADDNTSRVDSDRRLLPEDEDPTETAIKDAEEDAAIKEEQETAKEEAAAEVKEDPIVEKGEDNSTVIEEVKKEEATMEEKGLDPDTPPLKDDGETAPPKDGAPTAEDTTPPVEEKVGPKEPVETHTMFGTLGGELNKPGGKEIPAQSLKDYLAKFVVGHADPMIDQLGRRLLSQLKMDIPLYVVAKSRIRKLTGADRAHYDPNFHRIVLTNDTWGLRPNTILHEALHAATHQKVIFAREYPNTAIGRIVQELDDLRSQAEALYKAEANARKAARGDAPLTGDDKYQDQTMRYFLGDVDEFMAGLYSGSSNYIEFLKGIKLADENLLTKMVRLVRDFLGLNDQETTAFLKALDLTDQLVEKDLRVTFRQNASFLNAPPPGQRTAALDRSWMQDPTAIERGIDNLPAGNASQTAEAKAILHLHKQAKKWAAKNPKDDAWNARVKTLTDNKIFSVDSTALIMLKSDSDVVRYIASELLEDASAASGIRHSTASISKHLHERLFMGNYVNEIQARYAIWRKEMGGSIREDFTNGTHWERFNRLVAEEIEARQRGVKTEETHATVRAAADFTEAAYERMRKAQVGNKTLGWASLPESSKGYMPHRMDPAKVRDMTNAQRDILHNVLRDQFMTIEGWDPTFSENLARKYVDRIRQRAVGGHETPSNVHQVGAAEVVEDALKAMGMNADEVRANMAKFMRSGPGYTRRRIRLDLLQTHEADGQSFRLLDLFETDQIKLLRSQAQRVSGEVALARHGVFGMAGLKLLRRAMEFHEEGKQAQVREFEAFDQIAAEFMGAPFGTAEGKWMERARLATGVVKLGGIAFNQLSEFINGVMHVGAGRTLAAVGGMVRLRKEILALVKGEAVSNPIIGSIELVGGAQFGTDAYKMVFPFDDPGNAYHAYGRDSLTATDRVLRGGGYLQGKLSFWRAIHSAQQRGMAEQIVHKAMRYIRDGVEDKALKDMGITPEVAQAMKGELGTLARWEGDTLVEFDITKMENLEAREAFIHAVHRGVNQIIQGTFIGETGKWAHDGLMKTLTQFRTFSLISMEKQWRRSRNTRGTWQSAGWLLGSMSMAAPVYMARVYANSLGREDQAEYIEKNTTPFMIARATMNYVAQTGLMGDWLDGLSAAIPGAGEALGGRTSAGGTGLVGNIIAPSASLADDIYQILHEPKNISRILPMSRLPYLIPALNLMD